MGNKTRNTSNLVSDNNIFVDISNDRVGIGSTQPTTKLDVVGTVRATSFSGITTSMISDYGNGLDGGYSNNDFDNHINVGTANIGEVLSWTGSDYDWVVGVHTANINADTLVVSGVSTFQDDVNIGTGGATAFFDISAGKVGVGTLPSGTSGKISLPTEKVPGGNDALISAGNQLINYGLYVADDSGNANINHRQEYVRQYTARHYTVSVGADKAFRVSNSNSFNTSALNAPGGMLDNEVAFVVSPDTSTELRYNYDTKLETTSGGVDVTGHTETDTLNVSGVSTFQGNVSIAGTERTLTLDAEDDAANIVQKPKIDIEGATSSRYYKIYALDSSPVQYIRHHAWDLDFNISVSNDRTFLVSGGGSFTQQSGSLGILDDKIAFKIVPESSTELRYNKSTRLETTADGIAVSGIVTAVSGVVTYFGDGANLTGITPGQVGALANLVEDTTPQLGGDLDVNGNSIQFGDVTGSTGNRLQFGASQDLSIYHNGTSNAIETIGNQDLRLSSAGTGAVKIQSDAPKLIFDDVTGGNQNDFSINVLDGVFTMEDDTNSDTFFKYTSNGAVELYHNNSKKFETTSGGVDVTGHTETDTLNVTGVSTFTGTINANGDLDVDGHTNLDNVSISGIVTVSPGILTATTLRGVNVKVYNVLEVDNVSWFDGGAEFGPRYLNKGYASISTTGIATFAGVNVSGVLTASSANFTGNVSVGGTLTYEDVTNIDSIGLVTARSGVNVTGGGLDVVGVSTFSGDINVSGVVTASSFTGNLTGIASTATTVVATVDSTTAAAYKIPYLNTTSNSSGNYEILFESGGLTYQPSNNQLTVSTISLNEIFVSNYIGLNDDDQIRIGSSNDARLFYDGTANDFEVTLGTAANKIAITDNGTYKHLITRDGKVGINTSVTPTVELNVVGDANITGVITATSFSGITTSMISDYGIGLGGGFSPDAQENLYAGTSAGTSSSNACFNIGIGYSAGNALNIGDCSVFLGAYAGTNVDAAESVFIGRNAGKGQSGATSVANVFIGPGTGCCVSSGGFNVFLGCGAGHRITTGQHNIFLGLGAGQNNCTGTSNVNIGRNAGSSNRSCYNVFLGAYAGAGNNDGSHNIFIGCCAGCNSGSGHRNIAIGNNAACCIGTNGNYNVFLGEYAGHTTTSGSNNVAIGYSVALPSATGDNQLAIGAGNTNWISGDSSFNVTIAGIATVTATGIVEATKFCGDGSCLTNLPSSGGGGSFSPDADENLIAGTGAGASVDGTNACHNIFLGTCAGNANVAGANNVFLGNQAGRYTLNSSNSACNVMIGNCAGQKFGCDSGDNPHNNVIIGTNAGRCSDMNSSVIIGRDAGSCSGLGGQFNTFVGPKAGQCGGGSYNSFFGHAAGRCNSSSYNTAVGNCAAQNMTGGTSNVFVGYYAGRQNTGAYNSAFGRSALQCNTSGRCNVALGRYAFRDSASLGNDNIALGSCAGYYQEGDHNVIIGSGVTSANSVTGSGQLAIGIGNTVWLRGDSNFNIYDKDGNQLNGSSGGGSYGNSDVDNHINVSTAATNEVLSWNGTDYDWVAQSATNVAVTTSHSDTNFKVPFLNHSGNTDGNYGLLHDTSSTSFTYNPQENQLSVGGLDTYNLHVTNDIQLKTGSTVESKIFYDSTANDLEIQLESVATKIAITDSGTYKHIITKDGKVGINTSVTPTVELNVVGDANITGVITATSFSGITTSMISDYGNGLAGGYSNTHVDSHLNISSASSGQILSWNGSDYAWVADQTGGGGGAGVSTDAQGNTYAGILAGGSFSGTNAQYNTLFGYDAGGDITDGDYNTFVGWTAGDKVTTGYKNVGVGAEALDSATTGYENVAIGWHAGRSLISGNSNVLIGNMAGATASYFTRTVAIGPSAASNESWVTDAVAIGDNALRNGGDYTVAIGKNAAYSQQNSEYSVYIGYKSGGQYTGTNPWGSGNENVAIGRNSLGNILDGANNTALGANAGVGLTSGSNNILIGNYAVASSPSASNEVVIGDLSITKFSIPGIGVTLKDNGGTPTQGHVLTVDANGEASFAAASGGSSGGVTGSGTFTAVPGIAYTANSYTSSDFVTSEYTLFFEHSSGIQSQKILVMDNETTAYSQEYAIMSDNDLLVSVGATVKSGNVELWVTPETGVSGIVTYKFTRDSISQ